MDLKSLQEIAYQCLLNNSIDEGFSASSKNDVYGCFFGRDSALTILKILKAHSKNPNLDLLEISRKSLFTFLRLQGKQFNIESGEQPGKFIHEYRKNNFERLLNFEKPWFVYPEGVVKNYDSIDSTPLGLIAIYKYYQLTNDSEFIISSLNQIEAGLNWIITYGDPDKDCLIEYELPKERVHGGLVVQSWTDSHQSLQQSDGNFPLYPIAPVEAQAYAYLALKLWADFYTKHSPSFAQKLLNQAKILKENFNKTFILKDKKGIFLAQALDGKKSQIKTITGNPLLCLWASHITENEVDCIIENKYIEPIIKRAFETDLFDKEAGIRTMSTLSNTYNPKKDSYHNGSFWPVLNGFIHEGLVYWGYTKQAEMLKEATIKPLQYFKTPIELYIKTEEGKFEEYINEKGQAGCREQAWTAAVMVDLLQNS